MWQSLRLFSDSSMSSVGKGWTFFPSSGEGTTEMEVLAVTVWIPFGVLLYNSVVLTNLSKASRHVRLLAEYSILYAPQILWFCYPKLAGWIALLTLIPSLACVWVGWRQYKRDLSVDYLELGLTTKDSLQSSHEPISPVALKKATDKVKVPFISNMRAALMVMVMIAVLAVDFRPIFPRRFAKTHTFGNSLMDVGTGCIVSAFGIVAARHYALSTQRPSLFATIKGTLPLLILGVVRTVIVKLLDYGVSVSEYGVHWNFFMTLGFLPILMTSIFMVIPVEYSFAAGFGIMSFYEILLQSTSLTEYLLDGGVRTNIIDMNKEGIFSLIGYLGLSLMSLGVGLRVMQYGRPQCKDSLKSLTQFVAVGTGASAAFYVVLRAVGFAASRRMCNMPFAMWTLAMTLLLTLLCMLVDLASPYGQGGKVAPAPEIQEAISLNQLFAFLFANILTGILNIIRWTDNAGTLTGNFLLQCYMLAVTVVCLLLMDHKIVLRL